MKRRKFLIGAGSLAAGSAAAMGTGAFTSVSAERTITVNTAADSDAFLKLDPSDGPNGAYASIADNGTIKLNLNSDAGTGGSGLNDDAITRIYDIFTITNQGTQPVVVYVDPDSIESDYRTTSDTDDGFAFDPRATTEAGEFSLTGEYDWPVEDGIDNYILETGESLDFGLYIDTTGADTPDNLSIDLKLIADATLVPDNYGADEQS